MRAALAILVGIAALLGCSRSPADPGVPDDFDRNAFYKAISFARENYIDPARVNEGRSYVEAADSALRSLPYSLFLMNREFYENRAELLGADRIVPGRALKVEGEDGYVIFVPDYETWEERREKIEEREKARLEAMSDAERRAEVERQREREEKVDRFTEAAWSRAGFDESDFDKILAWIRANMANYLELPASHQGENPFEEHPYGMHYAWFAAANGYLVALDPHSSVIDQGAWDQARSEAEDSTFEGIGALLRGGGRTDVVVESPLPGSPALRAGLRAGDIIRKVDGTPIESLPLSEVVDRIRGPKDTVVVLEVERTTELRELPIEIKRGVIEQKAVSSRLVTDEEYNPEIVGGRKIAYIKVASFLYARENTSQLIAAEWESLVDAAGGIPDGLVLDLRGNPGGYLAEAVDVANLFLQKGKVVVRVKDRSGRTEAHATDSEPLIPTSTPMIVLIDSGSASASEIVASALMDHNRALVLGERSFGKATVQNITPIGGGILVKLTAARYYAPRGYTVQVFGVLPDVKVSEEEDGSFPPRFREENMWKHLPELKERQPRPRREAWASQIEQFVGTSTPAEEFIDKHADDALKPDFLLIRSLPYFEALRQFPSP